MSFSAALQSSDALCGNTAQEERRVAYTYIRAYISRFIMLFGNEVSSPRGEKIEPPASRVQVYMHIHTLELWGMRFETARVESADKLTQGESRLYAKVVESCVYTCVCVCLFIFVKSENSLTQSLTRTSSCNIVQVLYIYIICDIEATGNLTLKIAHKLMIITILYSLPFIIPQIT